MRTIEELEELLGEQEDFIGEVVQRERKTKKAVYLAMDHQMLRDDDKTIIVHTGLSKQEFDYVLGLLRNEPELIRRGGILLELNIRLVIFMQWVRFSVTYKEITDSFKLSKSRVQTAITDIWTPVVKGLQDNLFPIRPTDYHPTRTFDNHNQAIGALDATLIPVAKPLHGIESCEYLSGKHREYGVRLKCLWHLTTTASTTVALSPAGNMILCCTSRAGWLMKCWR